MYLTVCTKKLFVDIYYHGHNKKNINVITSSWLNINNLYTLLYINYFEFHIINIYNRKEM